MLGTRGCVVGLWIVLVVLKNCIFSAGVFGAAFHNITPIARIFTLSRQWPTRRIMTRRWSSWTPLGTLATEWSRYGSVHIEPPWAFYVSWRVGTLDTSTHLIQPLQCHVAIYTPRERESIKYLDFTRLYPYANKYSPYPTHHSEIFAEGDIRVEGLPKCMVMPLPPKTPVSSSVPYRAVYLCWTFVRGDWFPRPLWD